MIHEFIHLIESLRGSPFSLPAFMAMFVAACHVAPVSLFPVAGGVLFGFRVGLVINMLTILIGASGPFFLARWLGQRRLSRFFSHWQNREAAARLRNPSPWGLVLIRLLGFPPFVIMNYLLGLSHMPYGQFLWTTALGVLPSIFLITLSSDYLWKILLEAGLGGFRAALVHHGRPLLMVGGTLVLLSGVGVWMNRRRGKVSPEARN